MTESLEGQEQSYIFLKKNTLSDSDSQKKNIYAASVRRNKNDNYHRKLLLDEDVLADTFALVQLTISMESDQETEPFGHLFEINFERYNRKEKKAVHSNNEEKEPDTDDGLSQIVRTVRSIIPGL
ncbi:MAG: hypothetical protein D3904_00710 [Candidatus Electrothrix sp. EH2]|nr:hypothetical protein [Candidatus Electrothrix sp. EH2]